jgi:hypothetical protein
MVTMPFYEVKYKDTGEWRQISELELMDCLYRYYRKISPAIKEMINGKEIITPGAFYRLKLKSGDPSEMIAV